MPQTKIICAGCGNDIVLADSQPNPYNNGFQDNFYPGGIVPDDGNRIMFDLDNDIRKQYLEKYKKNFPGKKTQKPEYEDDMGMSTVSTGEGDNYTASIKIRNQYAFYHCPRCHSDFFLTKKAFQPDPNALDDSHYEDQDQHGTRPVDHNTLSPYNDRDDSDRGIKEYTREYWKKQKNFPLIEKSTLGEL